MGTNASVEGQSRALITAVIASLSGPFTEAVTVTAAKLSNVIRLGPFSNSPEFPTFWLPVNFVV